MNPGADSRLRALLIHLDAVDDRTAYYVHHVGMWTMSEIELARGSSQVLQVARFGPAVIPRPLTQVELGADLRHMLPGSATTVITVPNTPSPRLRPTTYSAATS